MNHKLRNTLTDLGADLETLLTIDDIDAGDVLVARTAETGSDFERRTVDHVEENSALVADDVHFEDGTTVPSTHLYDPEDNTMAHAYPVDAEADTNTESDAECEESADAEATTDETPALTDADGFELQEATRTHENGAESNLSPDADRWSKHGHDRLYFNNSVVDYLDLQAETVEFDGAAPTGDLTVDGDRLVVTVENKGRTCRYEFTIQGAGFEAAADDTATDGGEATDDPVVMTDGGRDLTGHFTNDDIESAIPRTADLSAGRVRNRLAQVQRGFEDTWRELLTMIWEGDVLVLNRVGDTVVLADTTGHAWREELDALGVDDRDERQAVQSAHHQAADRWVDWTWSGMDPFVVRLPADGRQGVEFVESTLQGLQRKYRLTPSQAWAIYGVEILGKSQTAWAEDSGRDQSTISQALKRACAETPY